MAKAFRRILSRELVLVLAVIATPAMVHAFSMTLACLPPTEGLTVSGDVDVVAELPGGG